MSQTSRAGQLADACPIHPAVEVIFSRWTTPILWVLRYHGRSRFNELQELLPSITAKVLTQRLRQLERDGLVTRHYFPESPPRVEYEISALGSSLSPVFDTLVRWSREHFDQVLTARSEYDASDRPRPS